MQSNNGKEFCTFMIKELQKLEKWKESISRNDWLFELYLVVTSINHSYCRFHKKTPYKLIYVNKPYENYILIEELFNTFLPTGSLDNEHEHNDEHENNDKNDKHKGYYGYEHNKNDKHKDHHYYEHNDNSNDNEQEDEENNISIGSSKTINSIQISSIYYSVLVNITNIALSTITGHETLRELAYQDL
ncbi:hypothetical protein C1645_815449 [Glomus cerebriforme]|uniref:Uncharacterized protein n=1 Tax=Glomus cerebriforme TaxID=658196 RepID=A0A397TE49_9GLOM|nr:hypothetical protein C1645_815449 [Glomus cerebriforme]